MGEPIRLWKGAKEVVVHSRSEADELAAHGWMVGPKPLEPDDPTLREVLAGAEVLHAPAPDAPQGDAAPEAPAKPVKKRAGEYGSGPGTTTGKVDKAKIAEVKAERAEDAS